MASPITITTASVPDDYCPPSLQAAWPFLAGLLSGSLAGDLNTFNVGSTTPTPDNQDKPWFRYNSDGTPDRWYAFVSGAWIAKHPIPTGIGAPYWGTEASIDTLDGGEAGAITATTGPMWQKVSAMDGKFPIGPGTLPSTTVVPVNGTGGEEKHTLIESEIPAHNHGLPLLMSTKAATKDLDASSGTDVGGVTAQTFGGDASGVTVAHNNMPPYYGTFFIVRSARTHYRI